MSRRGENIFKRRDGRWEGRYISGRRADGKAKYTSVYAHSYAECSAKLLNAKMHRLPVSGVMTINELFNAWLLARKNAIKESTYATYMNLYNSYVSEKLGGHKVSMVTSNMLDRYADDLMNSESKRRARLSAATVQSVLIMLRSMFDYAEMVYGFTDPAKNLNLPRSEALEISVFSDEEVRRIRSAADMNNTYELGIVLCLYTGLRIGEICALTWGNIDTENAVLSVRHTLSRIKNTAGDPKTKIIITEPKSRKSIRDIPLPQNLLERLSEMKRNSSDNDYFLTGSNKIIEPRSYQYHYEKLLKSANVPYRKFHNLRHTFATTCIKKGIDVKTVSELLGHSSVKVTLERYMHTDMELKREKLAGLYE